MSSVRIYDDPIDALEAAAANGEDTWEAAISAGGGTGQTVTVSWWQIGDLALHVTKRYGRNAIAQYAKAISQPVEHVKTARRVARFFDRTHYPRDQMQETYQNLSISHFNFARAFKEHSLAVMFLDACADLSLTCEAARVWKNKLLGKPVPPEKVLDASGMIARLYVAFGFTYVTIRLEPGVDVGRLKERIKSARRFVVYADDGSEG